MRTFLFPAAIAVALTCAVAHAQPDRVTVQWRTTAPIHNALVDGATHTNGLHILIDDNRMGAAVTVDPLLECWTVALHDDVSGQSVVLYNTDRYDAPPICDATYIPLLAR